MSSIKKYGLTVLVLLCTVILFGCGDRNSEAPEFNYQNSEESHPENWLPAKHAEEAEDNLKSCTECHGASLDGGISEVSCVECHLGDATEVHPLYWGDYDYLAHPDYVDRFGPGECSNESCHGKNLSGVAKSGPSCSACHIGNTVVDGALVFSVHPEGWDSDITLHGPYVLANGTSECSNVVCHGSSLEGIPGSGYSCNLCHVYP